MKDHLTGWLFAALLALMSLSGGCSSELEAFCEETTTALCQHCFECGDSDDDGSQRCGLAVKTDVEGCQIVLSRVCISQATREYTAERAQECRGRIEALTCSDPEETTQAHFSCRRLF